VTFESPWPSEVTSTVVLSGTPLAGQTWTLTLDIAGVVKTLPHLVAADETLEDIAKALALAVNGDLTGNLLLRLRESPSSS